MKIEIDDLKIISKHLDELKNEIHIKQFQTKENDIDLISRVAELEIKMSKIWNMLIDASPVTKEEKLSKYGKKFSKLF